MLVDTSSRANMTSTKDNRTFEWSFQNKYKQANINILGGSSRTKPSDFGSALDSISISFIPFDLIKFDSFQLDSIRIGSLRIVAASG